MAFLAGCTATPALCTGRPNLKPNYWACGHNNGTIAPVLFFTNGLSGFLDILSRIWASTLQTHGCGNWFCHLSRFSVVDQYMTWSHFLYCYFLQICTWFSDGTSRGRLYTWGDWMYMVGNMCGHLSVLLALTVIAIHNTGEGSNIVSAAFYPSKCITSVF